MTRRRRRLGGTLGAALVVAGIVAVASGLGEPTVGATMTDRDLPPGTYTYEVPGYDVPVELTYVSRDEWLRVVPIEPGTEFLAKVDGVVHEAFESSGLVLVYGEGFDPVPDRVVMDPLFLGRVQAGVARGVRARGEVARSADGLVVPRTLEADGETFTVTGFTAEVGTTPREALERLLEDDRYHLGRNVDDTVVLDESVWEGGG